MRIFGALLFFIYLDIAHASDKGLVVEDIACSDDVHTHVSSRDITICDNSDLRTVYKNMLTDSEKEVQLPKYKLVKCPANCQSEPIYGTDLYHDISKVCTMAVHMGIHTFESGGQFILIRKPCSNTYNASTRNGVTSGKRGAHPGSGEVRKIESCKGERKCPQHSKCENDYFCVAAIDGVRCKGEHCEDNKCIGTECTFVDVEAIGTVLKQIKCSDKALYFVRSRDKETCNIKKIQQHFHYHSFVDEHQKKITLLPRYQLVQCQANCKKETLYGTDIYDDDSSMCTMAVHMGIHTFKAGGTFVVVRQPCQETYISTTRNGIESTKGTIMPGSAVARSVESCNEEGKCPKHSKCQNDYFCTAEGNFKCTGKHCIGDKCIGTECAFEDIDECVAKTHNCPALSKCENKEHGFLCVGENKFAKCVGEKCENNICNGADCKFEKFGIPDCKPDDVENKVTCDATTMSITLGNCFSNPYLSMTWSDKNCGASMKDGKVQLSTNLEKCGTKVSNDKDSVVFTNDIQMQVAESDTNVVLVQDITVKCIYSATSNTKKKIDITAEEDEINSGKGQFEFQAAQYADSTYLSAKTGPLVVGQPAYLGIKPKSTLPGDVAFYIKSCSVKYMEEEKVKEEFSLVKDMCANKLVKAVIAEFTSRSMIKMTYSSFTFNGGAKTKPLDLECVVKLCLKTTCPKIPVCE